MILLLSCIAYLPVGIVGLSWLFDVYRYVITWRNRSRTYLLALMVAKLCHQYVLKFIEVKPVWLSGPLASARISRFLRRILFFILGKLGLVRLEVVSYNSSELTFSQTWQSFCSDIGQNDIKIVLTDTITICVICLI